MPAIHQLVAGYNRGDAISNEAVVFRDVFRKWGFASEIYSEGRRIPRDLRTDAYDVSACRTACKEDDIVFLHLSIGSIVNDVFPELPGKKVILYHNITPPEFLAGAQEEIARNLGWGREQAERLAGSSTVTMADSAYNARDLENMGHRDVSVLPLLLNFDQLRLKPDRGVLRAYNDDLVNILFVGRCVPNKRIEDLIHAFYYFQKFVEPRSRLIHVGSFAGLERYHALLLTQINNLELNDVDLIGSTRQEELLAYYQLADLFLCMSEHEGFCIPLIESMALDVPVLAYAAAAIPDTLDGAGVLFNDKQFDLVAEMMGRLTKDGGLREQVLRGQRERIARYTGRNLEAELREHLAPVLG